MTKHENSKLMGCSSKRDVYTSNRQPNCTPETTGKIITKKPLKISRRKEILKVRAEINEKEMKETMVKINKLKAGSLRR